MLDKNTTGFAAIGYEQLHRDGARMAVVSVRGRFNLDPAGNLSLDEEQSLVLDDTYAGPDPQKSPLTKVSDLVPFKPNADVTVLMRSYPRERNTKTGWKTGVKVGNHGYVVDVTGLRTWSWSGEAWQLGDPITLESTLVDYRVASSNLVAGAPPMEAVPNNPLGIATLNERFLDREKTYRHPMLFSEDDRADRTKMGVAHEVAGFAPIPPFWRARQQYAGTYDKDWLDTRHPRLPSDFDYAFYQSANPRLIQKGHLRGDEEVFVAAALPGGKNLIFNLPGIQPVAHYQWIDDREVFVRLNCDGVHIDIREEPFTVDITWRSWLPICPQFFKIDLFSGSLEDTQKYPASTLDGLEDTQEA